jgi:O-antigen ligase
VLIAPEMGRGTGQFAGEWNGLFPHKQMLGMHMALGAVVFAVLTLESARHRWRYVAGGLACSALTLLSGSVTSIGVLSATLASLPLLRVIQRRSRVALFSTSVAFVLGVLVLFVTLLNLDALLAALGKDPTLTGRVPLWRFVVDQIGERPWLGYGYQGFWLGPDSPSSDVMNVTNGWYPYHSHNGVLELTLELGIVGVGIFLWAYLRVVTRVLRIGRDASWIEGTWPSAYLLFLLCLVAQETVLLRPNTIFTALFAVAMFAPESGRRRATTAFASRPRAFAVSPRRRQGRRSPSLHGAESAP